MPHSGTRTLVAHLGARTDFHFGSFDKELKAYYTGQDERVHVPIRNPLSVAESWARRAKSLDSLIKRYDLMFAYLDRASPNLYKVEDLPRLAGIDDKDKAEGNLAAVHEYQAAILEYAKDHSEFFGRYYG